MSSPFIWRSASVAVFRHFERGSAAEKEASYIRIVEHRAPLARQRHPARHQHIADISEIEPALRILLDHDDGLSLRAFQIGQKDRKSTRLNSSHVKNA